MTTAWTRAHVRAIRPGRTAAPVIRHDDLVEMVPGRDVWDPWPVRRRDGSLAVVAGRELWVALSAPAVGHPAGRHAVARMWLASHGADGWRDHGPLLPDGASPGSREWAGCTTLDDDGQTLTAFYTAAGVQGEESPTFRQRIVQATGRLEVDGNAITTDGWGQHEEVVRADGTWYEPADETLGEPGFIRAFRDPFVDRDPATRREHMVFTASLARAATSFNGAVGAAVRDEDGIWRLLPPLLGADGVNNELERPHVVRRDGLVYLFFSTQRRTYDPAVTGPNGLYGFVSCRLEGPYVPLNESGLVLANPASEPYQAYSWLVLDDLSVVSFVDTYALEGRTPEDLEAEGPEVVRAHFGGALAPRLRLRIEGASAEPVGLTQARTPTQAVS